MKKFWAKVKFKKDVNAEYLVRAFFKNFNPESSIVIRGKEAKLEIVFEESPMSIVNAIGSCEVIELNYGKNLKEYEEEFIQLVEEAVVEQQDEGEESSKRVEQGNEESKDSKQESAKKEVLDESNQQEPQYQETSQPKSKKRKTSSKDINLTGVKKSLEEIAKKAISFEDFVKKIEEWLQLDKKQEFFESLVIASIEVENISWKELEKTLEAKKITYKQYDKTYIAKQVSEKFKEDSITLWVLLKCIVQYKDYTFKAKESFEDEKLNTQLAEKVAHEAEKDSLNQNESIVLKPRIRMECMPEIKDFEETLASVNKTQPVKERVCYVLEAMGLKDMPSELQKQIVEIATTAVKKERISFDIIFVEANIPIEASMTVRMTFSKFLNDFVQKYESDKKVKLLTFLSELQKIIMFEDEIESFGEFT